MLDGWTPLLLLGLFFAFMMFFIARKVSKNVLLLTSAIMSLLCIGLILFSIFVVGGWEGMGLCFYYFYRRLDRYYFWYYLSKHEVRALVE